MRFAGLLVRFVRFPLLFWTLRLPLFRFRLLPLLFDENVRLLPPLFDDDERLPLLLLVNRRLLLPLLFDENDRLLPL